MSFVDPFQERLQRATKLVGSRLHCQCESCENLLLELCDYAVAIRRESVKNYLVPRAVFEADDAQLKKICAQMGPEHDGEHLERVPSIEVVSFDTPLLVTPTLAANYVAKKSKMVTPRRRRPPAGRRPKDEGPKEMKVRVLGLNCFDKDCRILLPDKKSRGEHVASVHQMRRFRCLNKDCGQSYKTLIEFTKHLHSVHPNGYECDGCGKVYETHGQLRRHDFDYHEEGLFGCALCDHETTTTRITIRAHMKVHNGVVAAEEEDEAAVEAEVEEEPMEDEDGQEALTEASDGPTKLTIFTCQQCDALFRGSFERDQHLLTEHPAVSSK